MDISIVIDGVNKTFSKTRFTLRDLDIASDYLYDLSKIEEEVNEQGEAKKEHHRQRNKLASQFVAELFGNQFTAEEFYQGNDMKEYNKIDDLITLALGGQIETDEENEKKTII